MKTPTFQMLKRPAVTENWRANIFRIESGLDYTASSVSPAELQPFPDVPVQFRMGSVARRVGREVSFRLR